MSIKSAFFGETRKVRYAIVGLGDIAQEAMMPGVAATGNSEIGALVTSDQEKARILGKKYGVEDCYSYDQFGEMLASGKIDAIYLATPNWRHAKFILPALAAGVHVLTEKPLEVTSAKCEKIVAAAAAASAKLMVAYRLHFEPTTLKAIQRIRDGEIGAPLFFTSAFGQMLDPANHRAKHGEIAGPLLDMGPYPLNAARYLYGEEPIEVISATSVRHREAGFADVDDTVAVTLRFPGDRLAQFTVSYFTNAIDTLTIAGTKGSIMMRPAFMFGTAVEADVVIGAERHHDKGPATDQFGGELHYFSDCILNDRDPEPDAEEGLADVRVLEAIQRAIDTGQPQALDHFARKRRIDTEVQREVLRLKAAPEPIHAASPARDET